MNVSRGSHPWLAERSIVRDSRHNTEHEDQAMKTFATALLAGACTLPAIAQTTTYFQSGSGTAAVRTSPGGYGFAGEIDANGTFHGIDSNGKPINGPLPSTPGVTFFNPNDPVQMNEHVPFVRFGATGVHVDMTDAAPIGLTRSTPTDRIRSLCRTGEIEAALVELERLQASLGNRLSPIVSSMTYFRAGQNDAAASEARRCFTYSRQAARLTWDTIRTYYASTEEYVAEITELRDQPRTDVTCFLLAAHALACGNTAEARAELETLLTLHPNDTLAKRMLGDLPPVIQ